MARGQGDVSGGIGLIERRKQGQGRSARIYVKNFTLLPEPEEGTPVPAPSDGGPETVRGQGDR